MLLFHPPSNVSTFKLKQKFTISNARVETCMDPSLCTLKISKLLKSEMQKSRNETFQTNHKLTMAGNIDSSPFDTIT